MEPLVYSNLCFYVTPKSHHLHNAVLGAIQREASKDIKFPVNAWQFLKIQQLFLSVGHSTREGSCCGCSVLPASDTYHFSYHFLPSYTYHTKVLFVWLLFLKKSTFALRYAKGFFFFLVCISFLFINNFDLKNSGSSYQASTNVQTIPSMLLRLGGSGIGLC